MKFHKNPTKRRFKSTMPDSLPLVNKLDPVQPQRKKNESLIPRSKIVTRLSTGERWSVQGGLNWEWIAENVCGGEVKGFQLYFCAVGKTKRAGDWKIEVM